MVTRIALGPFATAVRQLCSHPAAHDHCTERRVSDGSSTAPGAHVLCFFVSMFVHVSDILFAGGPNYSQTKETDSDSGPVGPWV